MAGNQSTDAVGEALATMMQSAPGPQSQQQVNTLDPSAFGQQVTFNANKGPITMSVNELIRAAQKAQGMDGLVESHDRLKTEIQELRDYRTRWQSLEGITQGVDPAEALQAAMVAAHTASSAPRQQAPGFDPYAEGTDPVDVVKHQLQELTAGISQQLQGIAAAVQTNSQSVQAMQAQTEQRTRLAQLQQQFPNADLAKVQETVTSLGLKGEQVRLAFEAANSAPATDSSAAAQQGTPSPPPQPTAPPPANTHTSLDPNPILGGFPSGSGTGNSMSVVPDRSQFPEGMAGVVDYAAAAIQAGAEIASPADMFPAG